MKTRKTTPEPDFRLMNVKITKEDIDRNIKKVQNGEALDIPLILLNGKFKQKYNLKEYLKTEKGREANRRRVNRWNKRNPVKRQAFMTYQTYKRLNKTPYIVQKALWILYYYNKEVRK